VGIGCRGESPCSFFFYADLNLVHRRNPQELLMNARISGNSETHAIYDVSCAFPSNPGVGIFAGGASPLHFFFYADLNLGSLFFPILFITNIFICGLFSSSVMKRVTLLLLLLLASCVAQPYVQPGVENKTEVIATVVQCWDNSTAVSVEQCPIKEEKKIEGKIPAKIIVEQPPETVTIAKKLLADAKGKFTTYAYLLEDRMVIVAGNKMRHYFFRLSEDNGTMITDVFVDLDKKEAVAYCNVERESRDIAGDSFDWERSKCRDFIDKPIPVSFDKWKTKGPLDYLEDFAAIEPVLVENNIQTISIGGSDKTIQPSIHYDVNGQKTILRIDKRYQVPIKIEHEGERSIDFRETFFDVMVIGGKQFKITPDWLEYKPVAEYWKKAPSK